jgi:hypothetical protein
MPAGTDGPEGSDMAATAAVDVTLLQPPLRTLRQPRRRNLPRRDPPNHRARQS